MFFAVLCATQRWALHIVIKRQFFTLTLTLIFLQLVYLNPTEIQIRPDTVLKLCISLVFSFPSPSTCRLRPKSASASNSYPNWTIGVGVMTLYRFSNMAATTSQFYNEGLRAEPPARVQGQRPRWGQCGPLKLNVFCMLTQI